MAKKIIKDSNNEVFDVEIMTDLRVLLKIYTIVCYDAESAIRLAKKEARFEFPRENLFVRSCVRLRTVNILELEI